MIQRLVPHTCTYKEHLLQLVGYQKKDENMKFGWGYIIGDMEGTRGVT